MKKLLFILMVLLIAMPVMAAPAPITVTTAKSGMNGTIGWSGNGAAGAARARGFALTLTADSGATFTGVSGFKTGQSTASSQGYGIFPGTIQIDGSGNVTNHNSPVEPAGLPGAASSGIGTNKLVVALGSLYKGEPNNPGASGTLFSYTVSGGCTVTVAVESTYRGGVVGEDANAMAVTFSPAATIVHSADCLYVGRAWSVGTPVVNITCSQAMYDTWVSLGKPSCWCCDAQKLGNGKYTGNGKIDNSDLGDLKLAFGKYAGDAAYKACSDYNMSGKVDNSDLGVMKLHFGQYPNDCQ